MLKLTWLDFVLQLFPECTLYVLAMFLFTDRKIDYKKLFLYGVLLAAVVYLIRMLPIQFGVHTVLSSIVYIIVIKRLGNISYNKSISLILALLVMNIIAEFLWFILLSVILNISVKELPDYLSLNSQLKALYSSPFHVFFFLQIIGFNFIRKKFKKKEV